MNPYLIRGPALINFSGGRTSAYMLHEILAAHGGELPADVHVTFANTGKEREETLRFVHECETRWNVRVRWLERRKRSGGMAGRYTEVDFTSASRQGEPFAAVIVWKDRTPNALMRFCTEELKVNAMTFFAQETLQWERWTSIVGLRADEAHRVFKAIARNEKGDRPDRMAMPLASANIAKPDVLAFWATQPFDLGLRSYEGNCDLCFLKGRGKLKTIIRERPEAADWWIAQERLSKRRFVTEYSYAELAREVAQQPSLFDVFDDDDDDHDVECGLLCDPAEAA